MIAKVDVEIRGLPPGLLMHAFPSQPIENFDKLPKDEQAEHAAYRDEDTQELYVPAENVKRCVIDGGAYSKGKGRATLAKIAAACIFITPEKLFLGVTEYAIDERTVVNKFIGGGRVWCYRPRFDEWRLKFQVEYDDELITEQQLKKVVDDSGRLVGVGAYRPAKKGSFGRFLVVGWEPVILKPGK